MVQHCGLVGDSHDDTDTDIRRSCINEVLSSKRGRPITLCLVFYLVAKRLGVVCDLVSFPCRFFLRYVQHSNLSESARYTYINVWDGCRRIDEEQLWQWLQQTNFRGAQRQRTFLEGVSAKEVLQRMLQNHMRGADTDGVLLPALEMSHVMAPDDWEIRLPLARYYTEHLNTNFDIAAELLTRRSHTSANPHGAGAAGPGGGGGGCPFVAQISYAREHARAKLAKVGLEPKPKAVTPKRRSEERYHHVKWAVGQIMRHRHYGYTCVVVGWDGHCAGTAAWQKQMGVHRLERAAAQPFYHVLVMDGSTRYAAEDNMVFEDDPRPVTHIVVGKYFDEFCDTHYRMNSEKTPEFPEDYEAVLQYVKLAYPNDCIL